MSKPLYSICLICRDEEKTLPRLLESLSEFIERGGEICAVDTGSKDKSVEILRSYGCVVEEVGGKYLLEVDNVMGINQRFVADGEKAIVKKGDKYFNFSAARNHSSLLATNNFVFFYDCDEVSVKMDIDAINKLIEDGMTQAEYFFVFAMDAFGNEAVKFIQCKAYDKRYMEWRGIVHELICGYAPHESKRIFLDESIYKLAHYQNQESGRHIYLTGLVQDCFNDPKNDRHVHYTSRELLWSSRPKSALKLFKQHTQMGGWAAERAESFLFMGDISGQLGDPAQQVRYYNEAFYLDSGRNKSFINLALFYRHNKNYQAAICYAKAALEIKYSGFYADNLAYYRELPEDILYTCYGYIGEVEKAKEHLLKALAWQPYNPVFLRDTSFYFPYHDRAEIQGWMRFPELLWLFEQAASGKYKNIFECGSWKGKSTHALLTGSKGKEGVTVTCVDTWEGSDDERDDTNWMAKKEDVFATFQKNVSGFDNLKIIRKTSVEAAKEVPDESIDWCFVDMGHTYDDVMSDLKAWYRKVKKDGVICGHDYSLNTWQQVVEAVKDFFGREPDYVVDSIWVFDLSKYEKKPNNLEYTISEENGIGVPVGTPEPLPEKIDIIVNPIEVIKSRSLDGTTRTTGVKTSLGLVPETLVEKKTLIPRKVFTAWFGDPMPDLIKECIDSQKRMCERFGYEHTLLTLDNIYPFQHSIYLQAALNSDYPNGVKYCKATDFLRFLILDAEGGWFLDSDVSFVDGKSFDEMLSEKMVIGLEMADWVNGKVVLGTAVMGSQPGHPFLKWILNETQTRFSGSDDRNYESSMELLNVGGVNFQSDFKLMEPEVFFPYEWQSGKTNITDKTITIHHFHRSWIPENNQKSTLQQFKYNIENNINFTFVKRGDGELACMNGEQGGNCDGHPYSKELGDKLREAYEYLKDKATIVEFDDQENYNVLLHRTDSNLKEVSEFYKAISGSCRDKVLVAPEKLRPMAKYLKAELIVVPELNMFSIYNKTFGAIPVIENGIYMFCAGMPAKLLIEDMHRINPNATYLDCGSAFDPSVAQSRTEQISKEQFGELYEQKISLRRLSDEEGQEFLRTNLKHYVDAGVIQAEEPVNNFLLPQDTHPEKLWVIDNI